VVTALLETLRQAPGLSFLTIKITRSIPKHAKIITMDRRAIKTRKSRVEDQGKEGDMVQTTPEERLAMVWPLTLSAWSFKGDPFAESRLQRHIVHLQRRER
jgi:hypothetical protein